MRLTSIQVKVMSNVLKRKIGDQDLAYENPTTDNQFDEFISH